MLKKLIKRIKDYLTPLKSDGTSPRLELTPSERAMKPYTLPGASWLVGETDESVHRRNAQRIETARLAQDKDAIDKNLAAQHRLVIATLILALVAVISTVTAILIALYTKPVVVKLDVNGKETIQLTH